MASSWDARGDQKLFLPDAPMYLAWRFSSEASLGSLFSSRSASERRFPRNDVTEPRTQSRVQCWVVPFRINSTKQTKTQSWFIYLTAADMHKFSADYWIVQCTEHWADGDPYWIIIFDSLSCWLYCQWSRKTSCWFILLLFLSTDLIVKVYHWGLSTLSTWF